jgi:tripartite-type tricarboxylate transporter receptor subunit TctC
MKPMLPRRSRPPRRGAFVAATAGVAVAVAAGMACAAPAQAQTFPSRSITLVVGLAPGSGQDAAARTVSRRAGEVLGAQIVVENRPGGGTMTASLAVARAQPDGYTLLQNGVALSVNPALYKQVPYDAAQDFVPVAFLVNAPMILVINPARGVATLAELLGRYKSSDTLTYAHPGAGTMPHLAAELFRVRSGLTLRPVPYRGGAPALTDVIAGHVDMTMVTPLAKPVIVSGKVRALALGSQQRVETLPELPTFAQAGLPLPELDAGAWFGILAPKGTPPDLIRKLNEAYNTALRDPGVQDDLKALGFVPRTMTPEEFGAFLHDDMKKWPAIAAAAGLSAE